MISGIRIAFRRLAKSPGFTITAVTALALGVGANTAIFSLVNQLLLHPPGIPNPERVVAVRAKYDKLNLRSIPLSVPDFADVRAGRQIFAHTAAMTEGDFNYTGGDSPERLQGESVSVEWFDVFAAKPYLGRTFRPEEDLPNADPVVVLAHATWKRMFGGDPAAIGKTLELNQKPYRVVGVMGPEFRFRMVDFWTPLGLSDAAYSERTASTRATSRRRGSRRRFQSNAPTRSFKYSQTVCGMTEPAADSMRRIPSGVCSPFQ